MKMPLNYGHRPLGFRSLNEENETAQYRRQGWDPRKTYEENMGYVGLFDRPEEDFGWQGAAPTSGSFMSNLPSVKDAAKDYDFSGPDLSRNGDQRTQQFVSPWRTIDKDMLTGILYNEMSSFRGSPQQLGDAYWATANVIQNRQSQGIPEIFGKGGTLAWPVIPGTAMEAIKRGDPNAKQAYDIASGVADLITSAPEAFPSPWPYTHYNHRDIPSRTPHENWNMPIVMQYGPFDSYKGKKWLNIFGPKQC